MIPNSTVLPIFLSIGLFVIKNLQRGAFGFQFFNYLKPFFVSEFELGSQWPNIIKDFKQVLSLTANNPLQIEFV